MSRLALIGTFYDRPNDVPLIASAVRTQTRPADELWLMHERPEDGAVIAHQDWGQAANIVQVPIPRDDDGHPLVTPFTPLINHALDASSADYVVYLTDDSRPMRDKFERMAGALDEHPEWGAVYCWLARSNGDEMHMEVGLGSHPIRYGHLDHTQVMHRRSPDRWPEAFDMIHLADQEFWRCISRRFGPIRAVPAMLDMQECRPDGLNAELVKRGGAYWSRDRDT